MTDPRTPLETLQAWLDEYRLDLLLRGDQDSDAVPLRALDFSAEPPPAPGQIRLFPPQPRLERPLYGLIVSGTVLVPFSPYRIPAAPDEVLLRDDPPLCVLQFWNRRTLSPERLSQSWCVQTLPPPALESLPKQTPDLLPILHPADPRHEYRDEEWARVEFYVAESTAGYIEANAATHLRAAEAPLAFGFRHFAIEGRNERLRLGSGTVEVLDAHGSVTHTLDGATFAETTIAQGRAGFQGDPPPVLRWQGHDLRLFPL